jgi:hypothetical protein
MVTIVNYWHANSQIHTELSQPTTATLLNTGFSLRGLSSKTDLFWLRRLTDSCSLLPPLYNTRTARLKTLAFLLLVAMQPTLACLLLVAIVTNSTGVVSVSMEIFDYGCLVTTAFSQTRHNMMCWVCSKNEKSRECIQIFRIETAWHATTWKNSTTNETGW